MLARRTLVLLGLLLVPCRALQERALGVKRLLFVLEVDHDRARGAGWSGASREEVLELAAKLVERRFVAMDRSARVEVKPDEQRIEIALPSIDSRDRELIEQMLRNMGLCEFMFFADEHSATELGIDLESERKKLETWQHGKPDLPIEVFNALRPDEQGPHPRVSWSELSDGTTMCLLLPDKPEDSIGAASFETCELTTNMWGYPAISFAVCESRKQDLARISESHLKQRMAIVVGSKVVSAPQLDSKLVGTGLVGDQFSDEQAEHWLEAFRERTGALRLIESR
jgi:preprotein translocase subunit SecD